MKFIRQWGWATVASLLLSAEAVPSSEITVNLKLDSVECVCGEQVRAVIDTVNVSPETISVGWKGSPDKLFVEVFRSSDGSQLEEISVKPYTAPFLLKPNEGQKLETYLDEHYGLGRPGHFRARPVLVHDGIRYEGQLRAFDIVPGMRIDSALQMFSNHEGLRREFTLATWSRGGHEHLFLLANDTGNGDRRWHTVDLGQYMKITKPTISIMPDGRVVVLHRVDPDNFIRSEFWSLKDALEFTMRELIQDPETAGSARVRELYKDSGGIKPKENPWWKFW